MISTPDFDEIAVLNQTATRLLTYIVGMPSVVKTYARVNGWTRTCCTRSPSTRSNARRPKTADLAYHRYEIIEAAKHVPMEWMHDACAIGTSAECVTSLQRFRDAGADEVVIYGSSPAERATRRAWRDRPAAN